MNHLKVIALAASLCTATAAFGQNLILNGGFENQGATGYVISTGEVTNAIAEWTLQTSSSFTSYNTLVAPSGSAPNPADGACVLNIGGFGYDKGVGNLWQDFDTSPGLTYNVRVSFGRGNNDPTPTENVSLQVSAFNISAGVPTGPALNFIDSGNAPATGAVGTLTEIGFQFTAIGNRSRLLLDDTSVSTGPSLHLDGASVLAAVPEPSGALLAIGSGAMLLAMRGRRK